VISVVVPSLNQGHFIGETLDSLLSQDVEDLEVIVVDGGSTDSTLDVLRGYGDRITWTSERDRGQSDAINKGLRRATGDIVCYLNSDDVLEPGALALVTQYFADHPGTDWVFGRCRIIDGDGIPTRSFVERYKAAWGKFARSRLSLLVLNYVPQPATFWRAAAMKRVGPIDEDLYYAMDYDLWLRLSKNGAPGFIDRYLAGFRVHDRSKSLTGARKQLLEACDVARRHGARGLVPLHRAHDWATLAIYGTGSSPFLRRPRARSCEHDVASRSESETDRRDWRSGLSRVRRRRDASRTRLRERDGAEKGRLRSDTGVGNREVVFGFAAGNTDTPRRSRRRNRGESR
jgi:glycosyltransferase involved in cell wall biosynthesis